MNRSVVVAVLTLSAFLCAHRAGGEEPAGPAPAPATAQEERIAQLQAQLKAAQEQLKAAQAENEELKGELEKAKSRTAAAERKPAKPSAKPAPEKKVDESASFFPKGAKFSGTFTNGRGNHAASGYVLSRTATGAVLRISNPMGTRDWELKVQNGKAVLASTRVVAVANAGPPTQLTELAVDGTMTADTLSIHGTWRFKGPAGNKSEEIRLELTAN